MSLPAPDAAAPLVATATATASAAAPDPPPPGTACGSDAECVISTHACCPDCCGVAPYAIHVKDLALAARVCAVASCAAPDCAAVRCKSPDPVRRLRAVCERARCTAVAAPAPAPTPAATVTATRGPRVFPPLDATCSTDADCVLTSDEIADAPPRTYACCVGCTTRAVNKAWKARFAAACAAAPAPMCPPIGCAMALQKAVCASGKCVAR